MALSSGIRNSRFPSSRRSRSRIAFAYWLGADRFLTFSSWLGGVYTFGGGQSSRTGSGLSLRIYLWKFRPTRHSYPRCRAGDHYAKPRECRCVEAVLRLINGSSYPRRSAVRDHDLPQMPAALEMAVGFLGLGEGECPIDHGAQAMQHDGPVHRLEIGPAPDADCPEGNAVAGQQ